MEFNIPKKSNCVQVFPERGFAVLIISLNKLGRLMRMPCVAFLVTTLCVSMSSMVKAQDPLDEMYGRAVHSYFRGDSLQAEELLNEVIAAGSQDPRAYYFRGLCQSRAGIEAGAVDFERGAQLEIDGKKVVNVGKALERIQGPARVEIEKARSKARLASRARLLELQRTRYEEMQRGGNPSGGIIVPPRTGDPAPIPSALAPNDPFNSGMTKGDPKVVQPGEPNNVPPADDFADPPADEMPAPDTAPADDDPFADPK